jgi:hypothetical protein
MRLGELRDERRRGYEQDRVADRDGLTADRHRQVGLANPRRAEEQKCLSVSLRRYLYQLPLIRTHWPSRVGRWT